MKLGLLLLRGLKRKRVPTPRVARASRSRKRRNFFVTAASEIPAGPEREAITSATTEILPVAVALPPEASPVIVRPDDRTLGAPELLRPDEKLRQSIESFLLDQRSKHTRRAYGKDLKRFIQYLHGRKIHHGPERLTRGIVIGYKDALLEEKLAHTTIDRHLATLRSFFRWLVEDGIIEKSPAENVRFLNPKRLSRTNAFSDEEVVRMLAKPNLHTRTGSQHYAVLMVLFYCGLRRSELCELRTSSVGEERGHFVLRLRGKGNAERVIVMIPAVVNALEHYFRITRKDRTKDAFLFSPIRNNRTGEVGKGLDPSMIFYLVTRYAKLAGVANRVSPHSCRATAISNARDHQVPDRAIQEFAGWASPDMITRYDKRKTSVENSAAHAIRYGTRARDLPEFKEEPTDF